MLETLTKADFKAGLQAGLHGLHEGVSAEILESKREIIAHFIEGQGVQNKRLGEMDARFDEVDAKLDAIMEMLAMRHELRNLVRELRAQGIKLEETRIFAT